MRGISRSFRFFFAYFVFVAGAFLFSRIVLVPLAILRVPVEVRRRVNARAVKTYLWLLTTFDLCRIKISGQIPSGPCIVAYNHPTLFDALFAMSHNPEGCCIVKDGLFRSLAYGPGARALQFISSSSAAEMIHRAKKELGAGRSLIVFPEGTRGLLQPFHRSAARLALEASVPIVAGVIRCTPPVLGKNSRWYQVPESVVTVHIEYLPPLFPGDDTRPFSLQSRTLTERLEAQFRARLMPNEMNS